jgi:5-methylcytosine-specific restriction endonuclease McrA
MSENEAFRRILAARLARRLPVIYRLLVSGSVNLTTLELLRDRLTEDNHGELLAAVAGKSKRQVLSFLATRFPAPDRPSSICLESGGPATIAGGILSNSHPFGLTSPPVETGAGRDGRARIEPLSRARYRVEFTASETLRDKLELCRDLMSHANPTRDLAVIVERAVDLLLAELGRKRLGKARRPRRTSSRRIATAPRITTTRITAATRREVFERDGLRCTYVAEDGRRCEARAFLELDHIDAKGLGGSNQADNLRVRCRAHNQLWAEQTFGRERVEHCRHFCQKKSTTEGREATHTLKATEHSCEAMHTPQGTTEQRDDATTTTIFAKVHFALRHLGFREAEARRAISRVAGMHDSSESLTLEQALREAIHVATAA